MAKIPMIWLKDKNQKDQEAIKFALENNTTLIMALKDILTQYENEEARAEIDINQYDSPSWSHKQADRNGALRVITKLKLLFKES